MAIGAREFDHIIGTTCQQDLAYVLRRVAIRVGTPPQWVEVFISTASRETWVVGTGGCDSSTLCRDKRGGLFRSNTSSTWHNVGDFDLGLDPQLGFGKSGHYGFDTVDLGDATSVPNQIVSVINTTDYWLGFMGLGIKPTNFTTSTEPTLLSTLYEGQKTIPSRSYGYTAGAHYQLKTVPASLTLGGYDAKRFMPHDTSFELSPNQDPVVSVNQIDVSATRPPSGLGPNPLQLLGTAEASLFTIDSSTPFLWLPEAVCRRFEAALGLTYDANLQLYTFEGNASRRNDLVNSNLTFTFTLADLPSSTQAINITLPYSAFDLQLTYPYPGLNATASSPPTKYFPLRKAANETQYTIGRAFLQEAYLIVDFERNNFSVHQTIFTANAVSTTNLVDILPRNQTSGVVSKSTKSNKSLDTSTIIGIVMGIISGLILVTLIFIAYLIKSYRQHENAPKAYPPWFPPWLKFSSDVKHQQINETSVSELPVSKNSPQELPFHDMKHELGGSTQQARELGADREILELPTDRTKAVELPDNEVIRRSSLEKRARFSFEAADTNQSTPISAPSTLPSYHPVDTRHELSVPDTPKTEVSTPSSLGNIEDLRGRSLAERRGRGPGDLTSSRKDVETPMPSSLASALLSPAGTEQTETKVKG
ncbi:MAG: hypothetical protein M1836_000797 [Candelina mexicana]|nr:MAG: hypothetical protein M1836_000797 [Candelina mexicana]